MRRPWPSLFPSWSWPGTAHRYHRRAKRKYRAVAINGFTPEHLHVDRPRERERWPKRERQRGAERCAGERIPLPRFLPPSSASSQDRQDSGEARRRRSTTDLPRRIIEACIFRYAPVPSSARWAPVARPGSILGPARRLQDSDPRLGFRSNGRAGVGRGWQVSGNAGVCCCCCLLLLAVALVVFRDTPDRRTTPCAGETPVSRTRTRPYPR